VLVDQNGHIISSAVQSVSLSTRVTLPYAEQGDASGVPVLLLHGYADSWRFFEPLLRNLPPSVHVYTPSLRGHGDADRPTDGYGLSDFSADVAAFMDAVGLEAAVIAGQSSGGYIAQRFAIDQPTRTLGLLLIGSPRDFRNKQDLWRTVSELTDPIDREFVRGFVGSTIAQTVPPSFVEMLIAESCKLPARVWQATLRGLLEADVPIESGKITAPTLILWGDRDELCPRGEQESLAAAIPGSELVTCHGAGHSVACEQPAHTAAQLACFARHRVDVGRSPVLPGGVAPATKADEIFVGRMIDAFNRRDITALSSMVQPDFEFHPKVASVAGHPYRGAEAFRHFFSDLDDSFSEVHWELDEVVGRRRDQLIFVSRAIARGRASDVPTENALPEVLSLRDGKPWRSIIYSSKEEAIEAARLVEAEHSRGFTRSATRFS
jgi:non-heme chloroperoxidase